MFARVAAVPRMWIKSFLLVYCQEHSRIEPRSSWWYLTDIAAQLQKLLLIKYESARMFTQQIW